ncbi:uncharacterized protein DS421_12g375830 [Arachis hypogaea]|nr:uncharacterized protein DS421_12g375830 [Arachis hypogaea]
MSCNNKDLKIKISNVFGDEPDANELCEIFFQANNVLRTDENPNLSFLLEDELVVAATHHHRHDYNYVEHMADHAQEVDSWTRMNSSYAEEFIDIVNFVNLCFR